MIKNKNLIKKSFKFEPWDFGFMLDVEKEMLILMQKYHKKSNITYSNPIIAKQINRAIKLLNIVDGTDSAFCIDENNNAYLSKYINFKNSQRFYNYNVQSKNPAILDDLRIRKAWYLYCWIRYNYLLTWWD